MPRPLTGRIIERRLDDDRLAFDVKIRDRQLLVGYSPEWSRDRVQRLLDNRLIPRARLREPWWEEIPGAPVVAPPADDRPVTFVEVASEYVDRLCSQYPSAATRNAYLSPVMKHVGPFFAYDGERPRTVVEIKGALVSEFTRVKRAEREVLRDLADTLAELDSDVRRDPELLREQLDSDEQWHLLVRYGQRGGRWPRRSVPMDEGSSPSRRAGCPTTRSTAVSADCATSSTWPARTSRSTSATRRASGRYRVSTRRAHG